MNHVTIIVAQKYHIFFLCFHCFIVRHDNSDVCNCQCPMASIFLYWKTSCRHCYVCFITNPRASHILHVYFLCFVYHFPVQTFLFLKMTPPSKSFLPCPIVISCSSIFLLQPEDFSHKQIVQLT